MIERVSAVSVSVYFLRSFGAMDQIIVKFRPGTHLPGIFERNQVHPRCSFFPSLRAVFLTVPFFRRLANCFCQSFRFHCFPHRKENCFQRLLPFLSASCHLFLPRYHRHIIIDRSLLYRNFSGFHQLQHHQKGHDHFDLAVLLSKVPGRKTVYASG